MDYPRYTITERVSRDESHVFEAYPIGTRGSYTYREFRRGSLIQVNKFTFAGDSNATVSIGTSDDCCKRHPHSLTGRTVLFRRTKHNTELANLLANGEVREATVDAVSPNGKYIRFKQSSWWPMDALEILDVLEGDKQ